MSCLHQQMHGETAGEAPPFARPTTGRHHHAAEHARRSARLVELGSCRGPDRVDECSGERRSAASEGAKTASLHQVTSTMSMAIGTVERPGQGTAPRNVTNVCAAVWSAGAPTGNNTATLAPFDLRRQLVAIYPIPVIPASCLLCNRSESSPTLAEAAAGCSGRSRRRYRLATAEAVEVPGDGGRRAGWRPAHHLRAIVRPIESSNRNLIVY